MESITKTNLVEDGSLSFCEKEFNEFPICYVFKKDILLGHISRDEDYCVNVWAQCVPFVNALDLEKINKKLFDWKGWKEAKI